MIAAADAGVSPDLLWGFLPKPVAVALAVVLAITYVITEVTGKLNGPLSKLLARRAEKRAEQATGWRERDRRVEELERALATLREGRDTRVTELEQALAYRDNRYKLVMEEVESLRAEVRMVHRLSDHQRRAIRAHTDWDNTWVPQARRAGMDIPDPPDLYVYLDDEQETP